MEFAITIINDNVDESTERFQIVGVPTQNVVIPKPILTVTILDDDGGNAYNYACLRVTGIHVHRVYI